MQAAALSTLRMTKHDAVQAWWRANAGSSPVHWLNNLAQCSAGVVACQCRQPCPLEFAKAGKLGPPNRQRK